MSSPSETAIGLLGDFISY